MTQQDKDEGGVSPLAEATGYAGLLPFLGALLGVGLLPTFEQRDLAQRLALGYGATILSFVGAVHWGAAMLHARMNEGDRAVFMTWSVVPALVAWAALLMPAKTGLLLMAATFAAHYGADRQFAQRFALPSWYLRLRAGLSAVVIICLLLAILRVE